MLAGHNMGMLHTGRGSDVYGGHACVMGSWEGLRHYSAPVAWSAGFATTVPGGDLSSAGQMPAGKRQGFTSCFEVQQFLPCHACDMCSSWVCIPSALLA
jgi:hypothetical protein